MTSTNPNDLEKRRKRREESIDSSFILEKCCCKWNLLSILAIVLLSILQLSSPYTSLSLIDFRVTDGNVNGTLSLGTYGYCLYLPNKTCSHGLGYDISQFFFQLSPFITSSYLLRL